MAGNADLQRKLNEGVAAAKAGDRTTARRLLEEVVEQDDRNELAWIWLATVATGASERREHLRRVLAINPRNQRAREALAALGEEPTPTQAATIGSSAQQDSIRRSDAFANTTPRRRGNTGLIFVIAAAAFLLAGLGIILLSSGGLTPTPEPTTAPTRAAQQNIVTDEPTLSPTPMPSSTPVPLDQITRSAPTLPPTATFTLTPSPSPTLRVTPALDIAEFNVFYTSQDFESSEPGMYQVRADGTEVGFIAAQMREVTFAPDGFTLAFVRDAGSEGARAPEIFITTLGDPGLVRQITRLGAPDTASPSFSPDGSRLVFSSSGNRAAPDLWVVDVEGGDPVRLTDTDAGEREPAWSPAGNQIAFTSDLGTVGSTEVYLLAVTQSGEPLGSAAQATNADRSSYSPAWAPDGRTVVFASDRTGDGDLYTMDSQGNNEQLLTIDDNDAEDRNPSFSSDGLWITFVSNREDGAFQTYIMRRNGTNIRRITVNSRIDLEPVFLPLSLPE